MSVCIINRIAQCWEEQYYQQLETESSVHCGSYCWSYKVNNDSNTLFIALFMCRVMQKIQLDSHISLLDSPGVVMASESPSDSRLVLCNSLKVS